MHQTALAGSFSAPETPGQEWYYENYLKSPHWQELRKAKIKEQNFQCERCGEFGRRTPWQTIIGLQVHHLTYERLWQEELSDLEVVCRPCHEDEHGLAVVDDNYREQARRAISRRIAGRVTLYYDDEIDGGF